MSYLSNLIYNFCTYFVGRDATEDFDDIGHSRSAIDMMHQYYVGVVDSSTVSTNKIDSVTPASFATKPENGPGSGAKLLQVLVPLLILTIGLAYRYLFKKQD